MKLKLSYCGSRIVIIKGSLSLNLVQQISFDHTAVFNSLLFVDLTFCKYMPLWPVGNML